MKILSILLAILILVIPLTACSQLDTVKAFPKEGNPTVEAQILGIKVALQDLNTRLIELEQLVESKPLINPWSTPTSIEARLKILEEKVLISSTLPNPPYFDEDKISKLERRVSDLEKQINGSLLSPYAQYRGGSLEQRISRIEQKLGLGW